MRKLNMFLFFALIVGADDFPCGKFDTSYVGDDTLVAQYLCHENGKKRTKIILRNGIPDGECFYWHENGQIASRKAYADGKRHGEFIVLDTAGGVLADKEYSMGRPQGLHRQYYSADQPKRFTNFNDSGDKHGWEIFWYENGNVKDSIFFRNDSTMRRRSYYYNGTPQMFEDDIYGTYDAVSFSPNGKRTGRIKDGTGTVFLCDSVGGDCKELKYEDGKRVIE